MMYKAYTQKDWNAEKFYIEDEYGNEAIIEAESEEEAKILFTDYIFDTSIYNREETEKWILENPIFVVKGE